jgi:hypothetical protein
MTTMRVILLGAVDVFRRCRFPSRSTDQGPFRRFSGKRDGHGLVLPAPYGAAVAPGA